MEANHPLTSLPGRPAGVIDVRFLGVLLIQMVVSPNLPRLWTATANGFRGRTSWRRAGDPTDWLNDPRRSKPTTFQFDQNWKKIAGVCMLVVLRFFFSQARTACSGSLTNFLGKWPNSENSSGGTYEIRNIKFGTRCLDFEFFKNKA